MNYSYITLLTDDSYIFGIILLQESLKEVDSQYPLEVIVTSNVSKSIINILEQLNLRYRIVEPILNDKMLQYNRKKDSMLARTWAYSLTKFKIFDLIEYDKIIFLDADIMILKNLDKLFEKSHMTSVVDGEYFNLWPENPHFNSGVLVIEPKNENSENLFTFAEKIIEEWDSDDCIADQEILNLYYSDWNNSLDLHLNKYYNIFAPYIQEDQLEDIKQNAYFIHFIGRKPWRAFNKLENETYSEFFYQEAHNKIQKIVDTLDWDKAKSYLKIAIYGICKDEIINIEKYIKCFNKADYICILDTGSTDGTWEYLQNAKQEYSNLIIEQKIFDPWRYDEARNYSLTLIPKDVSINFMMDLDEIIKEDNWAETIKNAWDPLFSRGMYTYNRRVDPISDAVVQKFTEYRIHNNIWHYEGIVHEQLHDIGGNRNFFLDECVNVPITVWHYPTNPNRESYIELCEKGVKEQPNNWIMHLQLAAEYEVHNKWEKAITEYRTIIAEQDSLSLAEVGRCYASLGRTLSFIDKKEEALKVLSKGRKLIPTCGDNYFLAAEIQYNNGNYKECYELCKQGLENSEDNQWCTIVSKDSHFPYLLIGLSAYYLNNPIEGIGYLAIARELNNNEEINTIFNQIINEFMHGG